MRHFTIKKALVITKRGLEIKKSKYFAGTSIILNLFCSFFGA
jgi:hypothetical protein